MRLGDVYSLVIDTYATQGEWAHALEILRDMHERELSAEHFISTATIRTVYQENGMDPPTPAIVAGQGSGASSNANQRAFGISAGASPLTASTA